MAQAAHKAQVSVLSCPSRACGCLCQGKPFCPCSRTAWSTLTLCLCWLPSPAPAQPISPSGCSSAPALFCFSHPHPDPTTRDPAHSPLPYPTACSDPNTRAPHPLPHPTDLLFSTPQPEAQPLCPHPSPDPTNPLFSSTPQPKILPFPFPVPHNHSPGLFPFTLPHTPLTFLPLSPTAGGLCSLFTPRCSTRPLSGLMTGSGPAVPPGPAQCPSVPPCLAIPPGPAHCVPLSRCPPVPLFSHVPLSLCPSVPPVPVSPCPHLLGDHGDAHRHLGPAPPGPAGSRGGRGLGHVARRGHVARAARLPWRARRRGRGACAGPWARWGSAGPCWAPPPPPPTSSCCSWTT